MVAIKGMIMPRCCGNCALVRYHDTLGYSCKKRGVEILQDNVLHKRADDCPLVEIEEPKVGKWIYKKLGVRTFGIVCSNCNKVYYEGQNVGSLEEFKKDIERIMRERNLTLDEYCCHCGAEMVGIENE